MERTKTIDESVNSKIDELISRFNEHEQYWMKSEKVPVQSAFILFLASKNASAVLKKAKERISEAKLFKKIPE